MPVTKLLIALGLVLVMATALTLPREWAVAQVPPSNPLVAPLPAPSGPAQLPLPGAALAAPSLVGVPTPAAPSPTPGPRAFNCSCFGTGKPTSWAGIVLASGFFTARQAATSSCLSFNERRETAPPDVASQPLSPVTTLPQGFENPNLAGATPALPGEISTSSSAALAACTQCACD